MLGSVISTAHACSCTEPELSTAHHARTRYSRSVQHAILELSTAHRVGRYEWVAAYAMSVPRVRIRKVVP
eukprot:1284632-Rhodomonas_salina.2